MVRNPSFTPVTCSCPLWLRRYLFFPVQIPHHSRLMHINITLLPHQAGAPIRTVSAPFRPYHRFSGRKIGGTVRTPHVVSASYVQKRRNKGATKLRPAASVCRGRQIPSLLSAQPTYYAAPVTNLTRPLLTQSPARPKFKSPLFLLSAVRQPDPPPPFCCRPLLSTNSYFFPGPTCPKFNFYAQ